MKKIKMLFWTLLFVLFIPVSAGAYDVTDLPESMTMAEAMGLYDTANISTGMITNLNEGKYVTMSAEEIVNFYSIANDITVYRTINPTPFRGVGISLFEGEKQYSYYVNSGVQIGLYGSSNYICYKPNAKDTEQLLYLISSYYDTEQKHPSDTVYVNREYDFLKLPSEQWARESVQTAAMLNLLPYEFTNQYQSNISREGFCKLLGNFIAVQANYVTLDAYMEDLHLPYNRNNFSDCVGRDATIDILYTLGVVNGIDEEHFDPDGALTREQAAKLLCAAADLFVVIDSDEYLPFSDADQVSQWARYNVAWANYNGIMTGVSALEFDPQGYYTVQQAIATVDRLYGFLNY